MLLPFVLLLLPTILLTMMAVLFSTNFTREAGELGFLAVALYASSNSLLTLTFVAPYRVYTQQLLMKPLRVLLTKKKATSSVVRVTAISVGVQ